MTDSGIRMIGAAVLVATVHLAAGCAYQQPAPPAPPPAPTQLTIFAERGQSQAQQSRDRAACESLLRPRDAPAVVRRRDVVGDTTGHGPARVARRRRSP